MKDARNWNEDVILPADKPLTEHGGIAVLRGNLAPDGAVLKPSAASPHLMTHRGPAVVFEDIDDYKARIEDEALEIDENSVMVLKMCGPAAIRAWPRSAIWVCRPGAAQGHHRHGADFGRAHVGDGLRHRGPAYLARGGAGQAPGHRADRRHDRAGRAEPPPASGCPGRGNRPPSGRMANPRRNPMAAMRSFSMNMSRAPIPGRISIS